MKNKSINYFFLLLIIPYLLITSCKSTSFPILGQNKVFTENLYKEYFNLGNAYFEIERYTDALKYYKIASDDKNLNNSCRYKIAQCYALSENWNNALSAYNELLLEDPENMSLKSNIAYIYAMTGDTGKALKNYEDLLKIQPDNITFIENYLAVILKDEKIFKENKEEFIEVFEKFKLDYPKNENVPVFQKKYDEFLDK